MKRFSTLSTLLFLLLSTVMTAQTAWKPIATGYKDKVNNQVLDLDVPDANNIWGILEDGNFSTLVWQFGYGAHHVIHSHDAGKTWKVDTFPFSGKGGLSSNIHAFDDKEALVSYLDFDKGPVLYRTTDGAKTWKSEDCKISAFINGVYFWDKKTGIAFGDPPDTTFTAFDISLYNSGVWTAIKTGIKPKKDEYGTANLFAVEGSHIWIGTTAGRVLYSPDKGKAWQVFTTPLSYVEHLAARSDGKVVAFAGNYSDTLTQNHKENIAISADFGKTWKDVTPKDNNFSVIDAQFIPGTGIVIAEARKNNKTGPFRTLMSKDYGATWSVIDEGSQTGYMDFVSPTVGYASEFKNNPNELKMFSYSGSPLIGLFSEKTLDVTVKIFPNPSVDFVNIKISNLENTDNTLLINNLQGELIFKKSFQNVNSIDENLNFSDFPNGIYMVTITNKNGSFTQKIVKQ
jgi:photosystem II stability/assembly factor-like uncharacterized protein